MIENDFASKICLLIGKKLKILEILFENKK